MCCICPGRRRNCHKIVTEVHKGTDVLPVVEIVVVAAPMPLNESVIDVPAHHVVADKDVWSLEGAWLSWSERDRWDTELIIARLP